MECNNFGCGGGRSPPSPPTTALGFPLRSACGLQLLPRYPRSIAMDAARSLRCARSHNTPQHNTTQHNTTNPPPRFVPVQDEPELISSFVQLKTKGCWFITPLSKNVCEVTLITNIVDEGRIPIAIINKKIGSALKVVSFLRLFYQRNGQIVDKEMRDNFVANIEKCSHVSKLSTIGRLMEMVDFSPDNRSWKKLDTNLSNIFCKMEVLQQAGAQTLWGRATAVLDASAEECMAWSHDICR